MRQLFAKRLIAACCVGAACFSLPAAAVAASAGPRVFAQPEEAAEALVASLKAGDAKGMVTVLGSASREWVLTGDATTDRTLWGDFVRAYDAQHSVVEIEDGRAELKVGAQRYPFPFPILRVAGGWRFDPAQGKEELINRRIGRNELATIEVLRQIVAAQGEYLLASPGLGGQGKAQYAARFASQPGQKDGLYWPTAEGETPSPLGPLVADAQAEGYKTGQGRPYHGYHFRLLKGQGPAAGGGARDYTVDGLTAGYAVVAYPARYGITGVKSFLVNQEGQIYERDLGSRTATEASKLARFDPVKGWIALK